MQVAASRARPSHYTFTVGVCLETCSMLIATVKMSRIRRRSMVDTASPKEPPVWRANLLRLHRVDSTSMNIQPPAV